jgi:hypothetical protein
VAPARRVFGHDPVNVFSIHVGRRPNVPEDIVRGPNVRPGETVSRAADWCRATASILAVVSARERTRIVGSAVRSILAEMLARGTGDKRVAYSPNPPRYYSSIRSRPTCLSGSSSPASRSIRR